MDRHPRRYEPDAPDGWAAAMFARAERVGPWWPYDPDTGAEVPGATGGRRATHICVVHDREVAAVVDMTGAHAASGAVIPPRPRIVRHAAEVPADVNEPYSPDPGASALDRQVMELAGRLHAAGWVEEAAEVGSAMAELRENVGNARPQSDGTLYGLFDQLMTVAGSARRVAEIITRAFPDDLALRSPR